MPRAREWYGHLIQPWHSLSPTYCLKGGLDSEAWESWTEGRSPATDAVHSIAYLSTCSLVYTCSTSCSDWVQPFHDTAEFCSFALKPDSHSSSNSNTTSSSLPAGAGPVPYLHRRSQTTSETVPALLHAFEACSQRSRPMRGQLPVFTVR